MINEETAQHIEKKRAQIGQAIAERRALLKLSQEDIAGQVGIRKVGLVAIEKGRGYHVDTLLAVMQALELTLWVVPMATMPVYEHSVAMKLPAEEKEAK